MGNNLYSNLVNFYNVNDENFKEFMAEIYKEMLSTHRDVQYVKEHLTEEIEKILDKYLVDGKFNINIEEKVNEFLENNQEIEDINTKLNTNINNIENITLQLDEKTQGVINVAELGAKLDGRDETEILIKAHDLLPVSGGKIIIPSGKLTISSKIEFTKTIILEGVCVNYIDNTSSSVIITKNSGELVFKGNCSGVRCLYVDGLEGNTGNGITMLCGRPWVENLTVTNQGKYGLSIGSEDTTDNVNSFYLANVRARNNTVAGLFIGNKLGVPPNANAGCCTKIDTSYNKGDGIVLHNAQENNFLSAHIELNEGKGVNFIDSSSNYFAKPYMENNVGGDWYGNANSELNIIDHVRNQSDITHGYNFENENNFYSYNYLTKGMKDWKNRFAVDKLLIGGRGLYGYWEFIQDSANKLLSLKNVGTSQSQRFKLSHGNENSKVIFDTQGLALNGARDVITDIKYVIGTRNFGVVNANSSKDINITVEGLGSLGFCIPNTGTLPSGITVMAWVSDVDTVTLRLTNNTNTNSVAINQAFQIMIMKKEYLSY